MCHLLVFCFVSDDFVLLIIVPTVFEENDGIFVLGVVFFFQTNLDGSASNL